MKQRWNHIFFLHAKIAPDLLQPYLPFKLDLLDGMAILSIVPFKMDMIRLWNLPPAPFFSHLWEINLRTYVRVGGKPGVYFFTLDTDSALGCWIANHFFHLPYRLAKIKAVVRKEHFYFESRRSLARIFHTDRDKELAKTDGLPPAAGRPRERLPLGSPEKERRVGASESTQTSILTQGCMSTHRPCQNGSLTQYPSGFPVFAGDRHEISGLASFKTSFCITGEKKKKTILDRWTTDRDRLFTLKRGEIYEGRVHHDSWPLEKIENLIFEDHFSTQIPIKCHFDPQESSYAPLLNVSFETFRKTGNTIS
ncbi:MAG: DUF2071 domain-containing protein [Verrucomicrobia bacterium]|jgi:uncharacterized protein YqjF (DUF2071 family)|nr:MAG: DUF2071 domain-containing protein [Verrucomicrobiota bacterium]MDH4470076.1 DUF2071 domain-containing protein [Verrucomicrobiae bacterium]